MTFSRSSKKLIIALATLAISAIFAAPHLLQAQLHNNDERNITVDRVVDGDTIEVTLNGKNEKVRLLGVDTPETVHPNKTVQCFGKEASNETKKVLTGQKVTLEKDSTNDDRDKYGRLLRYVYFTSPDKPREQTLYNAFLIQEGYAYAYTAFPFKYKEEFKGYEKEARNSGKGLWSPDACNGKRAVKK